MRLVGGRAGFSDCCDHPRNLLMTMTSTSRTVDGVTILDLNGRIVLGEDTLLLRNTIRDLDRESTKDDLTEHG